MKSQGTAVKSWISVYIMVVLSQLRQDLTSSILRVTSCFIIIIIIIIEWKWSSQ